MKLNDTNLKLMNQYLRDHKDAQLDYGFFDCFIFTNDIWNILYGHSWFELQENYITKTGKLRSAKTLRSKYGYDSLLEFTDNQLERITGHIPKGSLVAVESDSLIFDLAYGICTGVNCAFISGDKGFRYIPVEEVKYGWRNHA